jgi:ATP-dependent DNA helicase RecQ
VFSDVALRQMARHYPANEKEFSRISGVGEKKLREFGATFLGEVADFLKNHPRQIFADDSFAAPAAPMPRRSRLTDTVRETLHFFRQGRDVADIAKIRGLKDGTVFAHLAEAILAGEDVDVDRLVTPPARKEIAAALANHNLPALSPVFEAFGGRHPYGHLRICRALMQAERGAEL